MGGTGKGKRPKKDTFENYILYQVRKKKETEAAEEKKLLIEKIKKRDEKKVRLWVLY